MIRRYLPKRTPVTPSMARELQEIVDETDNRTMRVLGCRTPAEAFADELLESAENKDVALTNRQRGPRHLPQPCHQPDRAIRVRRIPHHRLRRLRETALSPVVQPAEAVPAAIGDPADSGHPAGELRDLHTARLHPPSTIRRHHRQAARTLV